MGEKRHREKLLDVRKDRLDLRDRAYRPLLKSLPKSYPDFTDIELIVKCYKALDMILDQGKDGACTGYALASVINYLLWRELISSNYRSFLENPLEFQIEKVSEKMLFNLAKIYDEWDGEDYDGSSCRGAMKGWHKHGVCQENCWEFYQDEPNMGWEKEAIERPLGSYYRVDKESISDMQSALCEVGALYVSSVIHDGWWELMDTPNREIESVTVDIPYIPYESFPRGNHAFVIVGYTRYGFIVQNSWGTGWGNSGFAILSYKDWLEHGMDVWVAVMGVPVDIDVTPHTYSTLSLSVKNSEAIEGNPIIKEALNYHYQHKNLQPISEEKAYEHTLVLNSYGRAKHTIIYTCSLDKSIEIICYDSVKKWLKQSHKQHKVALYALGGFKSEKEYIAKIRIIAPYFLENGIYPIFLIWQDSYVSAIKQSIEDFFKNALELQGVNTKDEVMLQDKEALSRAIENHTRKISTRAIWSEVKEKALNANLEIIEEFQSKKQGVIYILTNALEKLQQEYHHLEIHALAHSSGSQLIATEWLTELAYRKMRLHSMHLIAPTLSIQDANNYIAFSHKEGLFEQDDIHVYMLDREMECADSISRYSKSLLCLISRSLERIHKTPLLGLEDAWECQSVNEENPIFNVQQLDEITKWYKFSSNTNKKCFKYILRKKDSNLKRSLNNDFIQLNHKNLDSSIFILENILKVITLGTTEGELKYRVENLC